MENPYWSDWARILEKNKLVDLSHLLLEGIGPTRYVFSSLINASVPFFGSVTQSSLKAFAEMVEDPQESRHFLNFLFEKRSPQ